MEHFEKITLYKVVWEESDTCKYQQYVYIAAASLRDAFVDAIEYIAVKNNIPASKIVLNSVEGKQQGYARRKKSDKE